MSINDPLQNISVKITFYFNILKQSILDFFWELPTNETLQGYICACTYIAMLVVRMPILLVDHKQGWIVKYEASYIYIYLQLLQATCYRL